MKTTNLTAIALILMASSAFIACSNTSDRQSDFAKNDQFGNTINVTDLDSIDLPLIASIKSVTLRDSMLLIDTDRSDWFIYTYDLKSRQLADSAVRRGQGPDEFVSATVSAIGCDSMLVVDNSKMSWSLIHKGMGINSGSTGENLMNFIQEVSYPVISYIDYAPEGSKLVIFDLSLNTASDSIVIPNITSNGAEINNDFSKDYNRGSKTMALAFFNENKIMIGRVGKNKFHDFSTYSGESIPDRICYTAVKVASDRILALSQKNVDVEQMTGNSVIEVFDTNCNPLLSMQLPSIYLNFDYNEENGFIILQSALNDRLYTTTLQP